MIPITFKALIVTQGVYVGKHRIGYKCMKLDGRRLSMGDEG